MRAGEAGVQEQEGKRESRVGWGPRLRRSKGTKGGLTRRRGGSRGTRGCDRVASASFAGAAQGPSAAPPANPADPFVCRNCEAIAKRRGKELE